MRVLMVLFLLLGFTLACKKDKCYDCTQKIRIFTNKYVEGFPKEYKTKLVSCGDHINVVDNPEPIIQTDTVGDTIYTFWKDTDCVKQGLF